MTFNFVEKVFSIGGSDVPSPLQFYERGFVLGGTGEAPSWRDIVLSGVGSLTLANSLANGLNYLKLFGNTDLVPETYLDTVTLSGGCEQRNLPSGYTQVEYLQSSGTQYIDTGVVLKSVATITTVGQFLSISQSGSAPISIWGFMASGTIPRWGWSIYQNRWLPDLNTTTQNPSLVDNNKHTFKNTCYYENNVLKYNSLLDGNSISYNNVENPAAYTSNTLSAYLFARNNSNTAGNFLSCRIFSYEIVQDGIKALSLIPCKRNSDNVLGMYDTVTGNFLTNAGTGTFTAGADTVPTPDAPMDIWCNNGMLKASPNLFNKNLVPNVNEYINRSNGNAAAPSAGEFRHSDFIVIKENTQYYVGVITSPSTTAGLAFYDDTKTYISGMSLSELRNSNNIITSPADTKYIRFSFRTDEGYNTNWQNTVYLVEGNQPLAEFMPYGQIYTDGTQEVVTDSLGNTASAERLLAVDDYKDTQEVLNGSVTRNISIKVLDGTESYVKDGSRYYWTAPNMLNEGNERSSNLLCSHFLASTTGTEGDCFKYSGQIYFYPNMTLCPDATAFKQWLTDQYTNGTPVIVAYPTSSATTESVSGQFLSKSPVTQTAGSIDNLPIAITESSHTTPTPQQPLQINCNNGVLKLSPNLFDKNVVLGGTIRSEGIDGDPNPARARTEYLYLPTGTYTISNNGNTVNQCLGASYSNDTGSGFSRIDSWAWHDLPFTFTLTSNRYVRFMVRNSSDIELTTDNIGKFQLEQGSTALPFIPYGQIYTDGTVETVEVTGKNLFNPSAITENKYISNVGEEASDSSYAISDYIYVAGANKITISTTDTGTYPFGGSACKAFYDANKNYISNTATPNSPIAATNPATVTIPSGAVYFRTSVRKSSRNTAQVEYGDTATTFEPYTSFGTATAEMLLKVGDYKDIQSVLDGGVTRRIGVKVLDGTENWTWVSGEGHPWRGTASIPNSTQVNSASAISTHFASSKILLTSGNLYIRYLNDNGITTKDEWLQFLQDQYNAGTPVIVVYPLAEATTESVTGQPLSIQAGTNIVEITQASIENLELEISYKATA